MSNSLSVQMVEEALQMCANVIFFICLSKHNISKPVRNHIHTRRGYFCNKASKPRECSFKIKNKYEVALSLDYLSVAYRKAACIYRVLFAEPVVVPCI